MIAAGTVCSGCHAPKPEIEEGWIQNGNGALCWFCKNDPPNGSKDGTKTKTKTRTKTKTKSPPTQQRPSSLSLSQEELLLKLDPELSRVDALLVEWKAGRLEPVPVALPHTEPLHPKVQAVADFYATVRGLRLLLGDERPVLFSCRWVGRHLEMDKTTVNRALQTLVDLGVLVRSDTAKQTDTYLPGGGS